MIKYFKKKIELLQRIETLEQIVKEKNNKISKLISSIGPEQVVESVLKRGVSFYSHNKLDYESRKSYFYDAQNILNNEVFKNETKHLISDWVEFIAYKSTDHQVTRDMRMCINAIELFRQRLKNIQNPDKTITQEDLNSPI